MATIVEQPTEYHGCQVCGKQIPTLATIRVISNIKGIPFVNPYQCNKHFVFTVAKRTGAFLTGKLEFETNPEGFEW
jgi:hypothetical protein